ncbi:MAG: aminotransferase class V-fold PLP-dependent enzyme [Anaerolineaceae bacterium]
MNPFKSKFLLDPSIVFLNHGSFGATPIPVFETYQNWQKQLESQPVLFLGRKYHDLLQQARQVLSRYIGLQTDNVVFVPNATYAVNLVARSLHLDPGDEVLTSDHEYGACDTAWEFYCKKQGAVYRHQSIPFPAATSEEMAEQFWSGVNKNTKIIFISHISSPTALRLPVEFICERARQNGILTMIDGAHAPGQISLDLKRLHADFYTGNCHKWMLSPKGAGFLYAHPDVQQLLDPLVLSWGSRTNPEFSSGSQFVDMLTWTGTHDPAAYLSVPSAIEFMQINDWPVVVKDCHQQLLSYLPKFTELTGKNILYPLENQFIQMAAIELPIISDLGQFKTALYDNFQIEIPPIEWNNRHFLRISYQVYNDPQDLDRLYDALSILIPKFKK